MHPTKNRPRRCCWRLSPDGFRELRMACLLSRKACASYLGISLQTVHHWDTCSPRKMLYTQSPISMQSARTMLYSR